MGAAVVAPGDAAPFLEPVEHDLDTVALAVAHGVVRDWPLSAADRRDARGNAARHQFSAEVAAAVAAVADEIAGWWEPRQQQRGAAVVAGLAVAGGVEL